MKAERKFRTVIRTLSNFFIFFLLAAFVTTCCIMLFISTLQDSIGRDFTRDEITLAAKITMLNVILLSVGMTIMDYARRKLTVERPVKQITEATEQMIAGDFSVRIRPAAKFATNDSFNEIIEGINKMASELRNVELLRADFINNFSHEFKTPIVSIAGFAQMLRRGNLSEEEREEYLNAIEEESMRLASMATNVLKLTKIENQGILSDKVPFNLSEQIRSAVLLLEGKWTRRSITFDMDFDEHSVFASEELLREVWINLIDNAIKFSYEGGVVKICVEDNGSDLKVSVSNSGEIIAPEDVPRIFGKFYQGDTSMRRIRSFISFSAL